jgi:hypothetical protein
MIKPEMPKFGPKSPGETMGIPMLEKPLGQRY